MTVDSARTPFTALAETYERVAVPAMLAPEALNLLEFAALQPGERVLDVACGTGIVARLAAPRLGPRGQIVGLDLNAAMLAVARTRPVPLGAPIEWRHGNAQALPFPDASFDAVLCQNGLQFMGDKRQALWEMRRVLRPERRLVLNVLAREAATGALEPAVTRFLGPDGVALYGEPFALGDVDTLTRLFEGVGFRAIDIARATITARCPSAEDFLGFTLTTRLASALKTLSPEQHAALFADARALLAPYRVGDELVFPIELLVAIART